MSNRDIGDIYRGMLKGEEHVKPKRESDLYDDVLREAKVSFAYDTGDTEVVSISDERARELSEISGLSTVRNQMLYKIDGHWVGRRLGKKQLKDLANAVSKMSDYQSIHNKIIEIAKNSAILKSVEGVSSFSEVILKIEAFIRDSAALTLNNNGRSVSPVDIKREMGRIIMLIDSGDFQKQLIDVLDGKDNRGITGLFKIFEVLDPKVNGSKIYFDTANHPGMLTLMPAGEDEKTRGAAGPGEAVLAFIYGGIKPKDAGDILLSSGEQDTIELKKQEGRIGKAITKESVKKLGGLFYGKTPGTDERNAYFTKMYYGDDRPPEKMINISYKLPDSFYSSISQITGREKARPQQEPGIQVFPKSVIDDINDRFNDINKAGIDLPEDMMNLTGFISRPGIKNMKMVIMAKGYTDIPGNYLAGVLRSGQDNSLSDMNVTQFLAKYSGVTVGDKSVKPNIELPDISVMDAMSQLTGTTPLENIGDLIGVWHLKHYLTHIQPFKWLLVYTVDGRSSGITYDAIINTPAIELVLLLAKGNMRFGIRKDEGGFHIEIR